MNSFSARVPVKKQIDDLVQYVNSARLLHFVRLAQGIHMEYMFRKFPNTTMFGTSYGGFDIVHELSSSSLSNVS